TFSSTCLFRLKTPATTAICTLSLHDALPISEEGISLLTRWMNRAKEAEEEAERLRRALEELAADRSGADASTVEEVRRLKAENRSEEHTSELQSRENLVCRLLLEKKKKE